MKTPEDILIRLCLDMRNTQDFTDPDLRMRQALAALQELVLAKKRVHSQLCRSSVGNSYGKDGVFEKNCGCIAYGYNQAIEDIAKEFE